MKKKIIAIIPARGRSKGIPRKNIKIFAGKPLVVHSIEQALNTSQIDAVYVSTDDAEIAKISKNAGAEIINRPKEISGDIATTESVIAHALSVLNEKPDIIILLQPTSPLRPENSIKDGIEKFLRENYDSLLSISPTHRFFWKIKNGQINAEYDFLNRPRRQDIKEKNINYVENGSLYIFSRKHFEKTGNRLGGKIGYLIFSEEYSYEIDTFSDFEFLEILAKKLNFGDK
ncbi:MAG: acylneuraminate cytidylyltransferase family protein [Candidatus Cloacimonetes bacterium]|nr:acylneuraminate cytidylyltransferase family protein [Candidatus Cloacimonadota bacterium]